MSWESRLLAAAIAATALCSSAEAWSYSCTPTYPLTVHPDGGLAPRNTHVLITLDGREPDTEQTLRDVQLMMGATRVPTQVTFERIERAAKGMSRQFIELVPTQELTPGALYRVTATLGEREIFVSAFTATDVRDETPPQIGQISAAAFGVPRSLDRGGGRSGAIILDGAFDDRADDDSLVLAVWDASEGRDAVPALAVRIARSHTSDDHSVHFQLSENADGGCLHTNYAYGAEGTKQTLAVALIDLAGNVSDIRTAAVEVGRKPAANPVESAVEPHRAPDTFPAWLRKHWSFALLGILLVVAGVAYRRRAARGKERGK